MDLGRSRVYLAWPVSSFGAGIITFTASGTLFPNSKTNQIKLFVQDTSPTDLYTALNLSIQFGDGGLNGSLINGDTTQPRP